MNLKTPKRKLIIFFATTIAITIFITCRKIDSNRDKKSGIIIDQTDNFFNVPVTTDARIKAVAEKIKRQNETVRFVNNLAKRIGLPVWNKTLIASSKQTTSSLLMSGARVGSDSSSIEYMYIPFDKDSVIDATLIVRTSSEDTLFRLLNDSEYAQAGFDTTSNTEHWNARDVFALFANFENEVFNRKKFVITDTNLFSAGRDSSHAIVTVKNITGSSYRTGVLTATTMCTEMVNCGYYIGEPQCDCEEPKDPDCNSWYIRTVTSCYTFWVDDGWSGGNPPYIEWVSGGGGDWWVDQCNQPGNFCGSPGWVPFDNNDFLNNYISMGYRHFETWDMSSVDITRINNWKNGNNIDTTGLDPCVRSILDKLLSGDNFIGRILAKMDNARPHKTDIEKFQIKIMVAPMGGDTISKELGGHLNTATRIFKDTIILRDSLVIKGTQMGIAKSLIHEFVHSYELNFS